MKRIDRLKARLGLSGKIVFSVAVLFVVFALALGSWVANLAKRAFLSQASERAVALDAAAWHFAVRDWEYIGHQLENPLWSTRLAPLVAKGNLDRVSRALWDVQREAGVDFIHVYNARGEFVASSSHNVTSREEPKALESVARELRAARSLTVRLVVLPRATLKFEGVQPQPLSPAGEALAAAVGAPLVDDFDEPAGFLVGFRVLNGQNGWLRDISGALGAEVTLLQGPVRIATSLKDSGGRTLAGTRADELDPGVLARGVALRDESISGQAYRSRYRPLPSSGGSPTAISVSVPISGFLAQAVWIRTNIAAACVVALAIFSLVLVLLVRRSLKAIALIVQHLGELSRGRLGRPLRVSTQDEVESLAEGINATAGRLRDLIRELAESFGHVEEVAESLVQTAEELGHGASSESRVLESLEKAAGALTRVADRVESETLTIWTSAKDNLKALNALSLSSGELAVGARNAAESSQETTAAMQEMSASFSASAMSITSLSELISDSAAAMAQIDRSVRTIADLTSTASELAQQVSDRAGTDGREAMAAANAEMNETLRRVELLSTRVQAFGQRSNQIETFVSLISQVAEQTDVLALNAAIIASQAGDAGKGFAVVAAEIRDLSEETSASTKQIVELIACIQKESADAASEAALGIEAVRRSTEQVARVGSTLDRIIEGAVRTRDLASEIAANTQEHAAASSQVAVSLLEIANTSQQLAAAAQQHDASGRHVLVISERMGERALEMQAVAEEQASRLDELRSNVSETARTTDRLAESATSTTEATTLLQDSVKIIREVAHQNRSRAESLKGSVSALSDQAEQVRARLSTFILA